VIAEGRMAQIVGYDDGLVVKLDRPEFNGVAAHEATLLAELARCGLPVPRVAGTIVIDDRHGIVMERLDGPSLSDVVRTAADPDDIDRLAAAFVDLHLLVHAADVPSAPDLAPRLAAEIGRTDLPGATRAELVVQLERPGRPEGTCHFDLHPGNVIVTAGGWKVIDWLTAARGPVIADFARTVLLGDGAVDPRAAAFGERVRRHGQRRRNIDDDELALWMRIVAAARLAEGFDGEYQVRLRQLALGVDHGWSTPAT
jgi:aminoglycoside phosphotransferase (APT) family kinase protein